MEAEITTENGSVAATIAMEQQTELKNARGIKKNEREKLEGHEEEYTAYFATFKAGDLGLKPGKYVLGIRVTDITGTTVSQERETIEISGSSSGEGSAAWGKVERGPDYAVYVAPTDSTFKIGGKITVDGFAIVLEKYKVKTVDVQLISKDGRSIPIKTVKDVKNRKFNSFPEAQSLAAEFAAGGTFSASGTVQKKYFTGKNASFSPGEFTLRVQFSIVDSDGNPVPEINMMKKVTITE